MIDASWFEGSMLDNSYVAWMYYLLGALGLFIVWWRITQGIRWSTVRRVLRVLMLIALVCPFSIGEDFEQTMAPATLMMLLETVFGGAEGFSRVGPSWLGFMAFGLVVALLWDGVCRYWQHRKRVREKHSHEPVGNAESA